MIQNEGSRYVNNPNDKGGPTKYGITMPILSKFLNRIATIDDVQNINETSAKDIYHKYFWIPLHADELPPTIASALFDTSINRGQATAVGFAQHCLVGVHPDGIIGEETIHALNVTDPEMFIYNYIGELQDSYIAKVEHDMTQLEFLSGWLARARRLFLLLE